MAMYELGLEQFDHKNIVLKEVQAVDPMGKRFRMFSAYGDVILQGTVMICDLETDLSAPRWRPVEASDLPAVDSLGVNSPVLGIMKETISFGTLTEIPAQKILLQGEVSGDLVIFDGLDMDDTIYHLIKNGIYLV